MLLINYFNCNQQCSFLWNCEILMGFSAESDYCAVDIFTFCYINWFKMVIGVTKEVAKYILFLRNFLFMEK